MWRYVLLKFYELFILFSLQNDWTYNGDILVNFLGATTINVTNKTLYLSVNPKNFKRVEAKENEKSSYLPNFIIWS